MTNIPTAVLAAGLALGALIIVGVLLVLSSPVPNELWGLLLTLVGAVIGASKPNQS